MTARILELCDAAVAAIDLAWTGKGAADAVSREYGKEIALSPDYPGDKLVGRKVYVFPLSYEAPELIDRVGVMNTLAFAVLVCERYTGSGAGRPPAEWMDERVLFVQQKVFKVLRDPNLVLLGSLVPVPGDLGSVDLVYDRDLYMQRRTFWSWCTFQYQEVTEP